MQCKKHPTCKEEYSWNPSTFTCDHGKYLTLVTVDTLVTVCDDLGNILLDEN